MRAVLSTAFVNFVGLTAVAVADVQSESEADAILKASGVSAGFFVHLGGIDGGMLLSFNIDSGEVESRLQMDALPAWVGLA